MKTIILTTLTLFSFALSALAQGPATWNINESYSHPALVISKTGSTYMSLQDVPKGTPIVNTTYWVTLDSMVPSETPTGQENLSTPNITTKPDTLPDEVKDDSKTGLGSLPSTPPSTVPGKPPADDYQETIAALQKQIEKLTANLDEANRQIANKDETIYELEEANQELIKQNGELSKKLAGEIEKNDVLSAQVNNLTHERDNLTYELNLSKKQADEAVRMAQIPFINGWVYDNDRGWIFTDAEHYPMVYTHKDNTWHYFELGSNPRYFFNFTSQQWEAWDDLPEENDQNVASNDNL